MIAAMLLKQNMTTLHIGENRKKAQKQNKTKYFSILPNHLY